MNLTHLAPDIQEQVLFLEAVDGREPMSERDLRTVLSAGDWGAQRAEWQILRIGTRDSPMAPDETQLNRIVSSCIR